LGGFARGAYHRAAVWKNSETLALDIVSLYPNAANAQEELGRIYQQRGLRAVSAAHFKAAYLSDPSLRRLIQFYELFSLNQPLIALYQRALQETPSDSRLNAGLGMVYFRIKQFVMAEEYLQVALKNDSYNHSLYNVLAGAFYYQNRIPEAIASWQKALAIDPNYADASNNLGAAYLAQGKKEEARALFEKVLALNPQHPIARRNLEKLARVPETNL
ncbi:MAG: tetratricopeptide repeat protein, partial [Candidatus Omnitrophica bacterium]|nr:tetratricopeptide repeat protein [Candidatus Omnitrophota bacterium]